MAAPNPPAGPTQADLANLEYLAQDANGDFVYSNEKSLFGFVSAHQYLQIPNDLTATTVACSNLTVDNMSGNLYAAGLLGAGNAAYLAACPYIMRPSRLDQFKVLALNYKSMVNGGMPPLHAYIAASLRARWFMLGCFDVANDTTNVATLRSEIVRVTSDAAGTIPQQICAATTIAEVYATEPLLFAQMFTYNNHAEYGSSWATQNAEIVWCAAEHVVRVRGHHYKNDYADLIKRYFRACHEGNAEFPETFSLEHVFRTAIHPFGLKALPIMFGHFISHGKAANSAFLRRNGAPNGLAVVTTTAACVRVMQSETWFNRFRDLYKPQIDLLFACEEYILDHKYSCHMSARIYGVAPLVTANIMNTDMNTEQIREVGATMAVHCAGFLSAMKSAYEQNLIPAFSFANAKALDKYAGQAPLATLRIKALIEFAVNAVSDSKTIEEAMVSALPGPKPVTITN